MSNETITKVVASRPITLLGRDGRLAIGLMTMAQAIAIVDPFQRVMSWTSR